jgi:hypothetical protein
VIEHKVEQGSAEWFALRSGIPSASEFDQIITPKTMKPSESRWKYAVRLVAERLMNYQAQSLEGIGHIQDGKANEPKAVRQLAFSHDLEIRTCGFFTTDDRRWGASPDRMVVGREEPVEVKCPTDLMQMQYLLLDNASIYRCQRQGQLLVAEADKAHFYSFHPLMPEVYEETGRDEPFIDKLSQALEQFSDELAMLMERAKSRGLIFQKYDSIGTPLDIELGHHLLRK